MAVLTLLATAWGIYYARKQAHAADEQLREAEHIKEQTQTFVERQMREDDLWSEKYVRAGKLLCRLAERGVYNNTLYTRGRLDAVFQDLNVQTQIRSHLIEEHDGTVPCTMRTLDVTQLRLKAIRDLIDLVLNTVEDFRTRNPQGAKELGIDGK